MIDANCPIWKAGKGLCWAPSEAWGLSDREVCSKCKVKNKPKAIIIPYPSARICRACGLHILAQSLWDAERETCTRPECMISLKAANL